MKKLQKIVMACGSRGLLNWIPDKLYISIIWKLNFNSKINLQNPKSFNEKLQWLKLYDRKDIYTTMVDKIEAKEYVSKIIGNKYIIPTIKIYDKVSDINFQELPNSFVIKCTHGSHCSVIVNNKNNIDIKKVKKQLNKWLKRNWFWYGREWPYKNVKPRILIEKYMEDDKEHELRDYKIYAFNGACEYVMLCFDRYNDGTKFIYFDRNWRIKKEFSRDGIKYGDNILVNKPKNLDKMFNFAKVLSKDIPFVRVDFYEANGNLYFGELTFYPSSGFDSTRTKECEEYLSEQLIINLN